MGIQRQYSGVEGKIENCQVATVLSYASKAGHIFLDRRLSLPQEEWCWDRARRDKAKVPKEIRFQTKPKQTIAMLEHGWRAGGTDAALVTGDRVYGDAPRLREAVQAQGKWYVLAVSSATPVWTERPAVIPPQELTGGRPVQLEQLAPGPGQPQPAP